MSHIASQFSKLTASIAKSDIDEIKKILTHPNAKEIVNMVDSEQWHSLFHTIRIANEDVGLQIVCLLIQKGANPYQKEDNQQTVLYYLAKEGKAKIIEKLLSTFKYDLNDVDKYCQNPLYWAASHGRLKVAQLLIKYGVNINHIDSNGQTCLFYAARQGQLQICKFLINRGCKYDLIDKNKKNPLHFAKIAKHPSVIEYLTSLKESIKPTKITKQPKPVEAKIQKKKKDIQRSEYLLIYTNEDGISMQMNLFDMEALFKDKVHHKYSILECVMQPEILDDIEIKNDRKNNFIRIATKMINTFLKRPDLELFKQPVNTAIYVDYLNHVDRPMDFSLIKHKLNFNCYENEQQLKNDVLLIYDNCIRYNGAESIYGKMANQLKLECQQICKREFGTLY